MSLPLLPASSPTWQDGRACGYTPESTGLDEADQYPEGDEPYFSDHYEGEDGDDAMGVLGPVLKKLKANPEMKLSDVMREMDEVMGDHFQVDSEDLSDGLQDDFEESDASMSDLDIVEDACIGCEDFTDDSENTKDNHPILRKRVFCRYVGGAFVANFSPLICQGHSPFRMSNYKPPEWIFNVPNLQILYLSENAVNSYCPFTIDLTRLPSSVKYIEMSRNLYGVCEGYSSLGDALPNLTYLRRTCMEHEEVSLTGGFGTLKQLRYLDIENVCDISAVSTVTSLRCVGFHQDGSSQKVPSWKNLKELIYHMPFPQSEYTPEREILDLSYLSENTSLLSLTCMSMIDPSVLNSLTNLRCLHLVVDFYIEKEADVEEIPAVDYLSCLPLLQHLRSLNICVWTPYKYDKFPSVKEKVEERVEKFKAKTREIVRTLPNLMYFKMECSSSEPPCLDEELETRMNENLQNWKALFDSIRNIESASSILSRFDADNSLLWYGTIEYDPSKRSLEASGVYTFDLEYNSSPFLAAVDAGHLELVKAVLEKYPLTTSASLSPPHTSSPDAASFVNRFVFDSAPLNVCLRALNRVDSS